MMLRPVAAFLLILFVAVPARADTETDCRNFNLEPDRVIAACTELISQRHLIKRGYYDSHYTHRAASYLKVGQLDAAISDLNNAVQLYPDEYIAYFLRGIAYEMAGDEQRSSVEFDRAFGVVTPHFGATHRKTIGLFNYGVARELAGHKERAIRAYRQVNALEPDSLYASLARRGLMNLGVWE